MASLSDFELISSPVLYHCNIPIVVFIIRACFFMVVVAIFTHNSSKFPVGLLRSAPKMYQMQLVS